MPQVTVFILAKKTYMGYAVADDHMRFHIAGMSGKKLGTTRMQKRCQEIAWKLLYQSDVFLYEMCTFCAMEIRVVTQLYETTHRLCCVSHERAQTTCHTSAHRPRVTRARTGHSYLQQHRDTSATQSHRDRTVV